MGFKMMGSMNKLIFGCQQNATSGLAYTYNRIGHAVKLKVIYKNRK
jgi:hypothetical protein